MWDALVRSTYAQIVMSVPRAHVGCLTPTEGFIDTLMCVPRMCGMPCPVLLERMLFLMYASKAFKFRIYPNKEQVDQIETSFNACIKVWNLALELKDAAYKNDGTSLSSVDLNKMIPKWKKVLPWLAIAPNSALQQVCRNLDQAYKNAFRRLKRGEEPGFPKYKKMRSGHKSYKTPAGGRKGTDGKVIVRTQAVRVVDEHHVILPKLGSVKCRGMQHELLDGTCGHVLSGTVSRTPTGKYYLSIGCENTLIPDMPDGMVDVMGVRLGVSELAVRSDGMRVENPKARARYEKKLRREQRRLSRKTKGSANYRKQCARKAKVDERIANIRSDATHKLSKDIVRDSKAVSIRRVDVKDMMAQGTLPKCAKKNINRAISDAAMYETSRRIQYKCDWYGRPVVEVPSGEVTTTLCRQCGETYDHNGPLGATWTCPYCGSVHDTALNAARNVASVGQRMIMMAS